jgi:predicted ester cyclase
MSVEHKKALVERLFVEINDGQRYDLLDELCHADVVIHDPIGGDSQGIEAFRGLFMFFRQAFGEQRTELRTYVAEGEYVALLHTHHAKSTGSFLGAPPTGAWLAIPGLELFRMSDGKIAEFWRFDADAMLLAQLGLFAVPQAA